jgi:Domain of unknown function (DUF4349)
METHRDDIDLATELRALRPAPHPDFTEKLDARAAAGFPREEQQRHSLLSRIGNALGTVSPRRIVLPAAAVGLTALVAATAVISLGEQGSEAPQRTAISLGEQGPETPPRTPTTAKSAAGQAPADSAETLGFKYSDAPPVKSSAAAESASRATSGSRSGFSAARAHRSVERDAELVLRTAPDDFGEAVKRAFSTVHAVNGIVLSSEVHDRASSAGDGGGGEANAGFQLLIPSARLGDALASLSRIADVRSRHESTLDITAPTVTAEERLDDARARIEGLLTQLAGAESEEERIAIESELRGERREAAALRAQLDRLQRRAGFARVSLRIESGAERGSSGAGRWGIGDALDDAARILTVAAGVALIGLAVVGPLALIAVAAWLAHRVWVRRRRESALAQAA